MAAASEPDYACGYCYENFGDMVDPRRLPCGHVFCLACLRNDFSAGGTKTKCPTCSELHTDLNLDDLPEPDMDGDEEEEDKLPVVYCSHRSGCQQAAVCYCGDCCSKLCKKHKEAHDEYLDNSHTYVPFDEYRRLPEKYDRPLCTTHGHAQSLACEGCDIIVCQECELTSNCPQSGSHKFKSLAKLEKKLNQEYTVFIDEISAMHSEFSKKEKDTFCLFDDLVDTYNEEEKLKAVDAEAERQVAEIRRRAEIQKELVKRFPAKMDAEVTSYAETLQEKESQLGDLQKSLSQLMREAHITQVIRENKSNRTKISNAKQLVTGNCDILREMVVMPTGFLRDIEVKLRPLVPRKLVKFYNGGSTGQTANYLLLTDQGNLLVADNSGYVKIMDTHYKHTKASLAIANVVGFAQSKDRVFIIRFINGQLICDKYDYNLDNALNICQFPTQSVSGNNQIAVVDDKVVIVDNASYSFQLRVYNHKGQHLRDVPFGQRISGVWTLSQGNVLVLDGDGKLHDCVVESASTSHRCLKKSLPGESVTYCAGLAYGSTAEYRTQQKIQLYKMESGENVCALVTEETNYLYQLSVRGNMLAMVDDRARIQMYYIQY